MVNFICDACGQTLKKQKVEKHYQTECRACSVLSCLDCGVDFPGDTYISHISCISEAEKYQGKLYKSKDKANKGERKQQEWLELVRSTSTDSKQDPRVRKLMAKITSYNNVPRKEKKFKKFCENSINIRDQGLLEKLWQTFSGARNSNANKNESNDDQNSTSSVKEQETKTTSNVENGESENSERKTVEIANEDEKPQESPSGKSCKELKQEKRNPHQMENESGFELADKTNNDKILEDFEQDERTQGNFKKKSRKELKREKRRQKMEIEDGFKQIIESKDGKILEDMKQDERIPDKPNKKSRKKLKREKTKSEKTENEDGVKQVDESQNHQRWEQKNEKKRKMKEDINCIAEEESFVRNKKQKIKRERIIERGDSENKTEQNGSETRGHDCEENGGEEERNCKAGKNKTKRVSNDENTIEPNTNNVSLDQKEDGFGNNEEMQHEKFRWEAVIKRLLKSAPENEMAVKKLRKKVINEFLAHGGDHKSRTEQELKTLFEKKLHKNPKVKVHKERAKYCK